LSEHVTSSGLVVTDRRAAVHERAFGRDTPNGNTPTGSVGPDAAVSGQVVTAAPADGGPPTVPPTPTVQPWSGWPDEWQTPLWNQGVGLQARVSTVFTCVDLNSSALASMTPILKRQGVPVSPFEREWIQNPQPELYAHWGEFMQQAVVSLEMRGNAYLMVTARYGDGRPRRFFVMDPDLITVGWDRGLRTYTFQNGDPIDPADILHLRYLTVAGQAYGLSPLEGARGNLVSAAALERYGAMLASKGGVPWAVLHSPDRLTSAQSTGLQTAWTTAAARRDGAPAVLSGGLELKPLTLSPKDMALLDLRVFDEQRIASTFGVSPFLVGLPQPEGMTYATTTGLFEFHHRRKLRPLGSNIGTALSAWALPFGEELSLNASEYTQGTQAERVATWLPALEKGAISNEEFRALTGLPSAAAGAPAIDSTTSGTQ
jgi:HK97 family phage portal protein